MTQIKPNMRGMQETKRAPIVVTHLLDSGSAFATRTDNAQRVFIPPKVTAAARLEVGVAYDANLIENRHWADNSVEYIPHFAVFIYPNGDRADVLLKLLRRVEEGETSSRDAVILKSIFEDLRLIPPA